MSGRSSAVGLLLALGLVTFDPAAASAPVKWSSDGCVIDGMLFSVKDAEAGGRAHRIHPVRIDLSRYEGKRVRVTGWLRPGDVLDLERSGGLRVLGACGHESRAAIAGEVAWAHNGEATERMASGDLTGALQHVERAIALDGSVSAFYLTRARLNDHRGRLAEAAQDAATALEKGADPRYPDLEFAGDLLERSGRRTEARAAFRKAVRICGYPPDRARLQERVAQLERSVR